MISNPFFKCVAIPMQLLADNSLSANDKIVYVSIMSLVGGEHNGDVPQKELAKQLDMSVATLNKSIKVLCDKKFIELTRDNSNLPARYVLLALPYESDVSPEIPIEVEQKTRISETKTPTTLSSILSTDTDNESKIGNFKGAGLNVRVLGKELNKLNSPDLCKFWVTRYFGKFKIPYGNPNGKERALMKRLIEEYGSEIVWKAVKYVIDEKTVIEGYPSISALYGFRKTIIPESQKGKVTKKAISDRQFQNTEWDEKDGF